jgi:Family of unknown function (DUF5683)
MKWIACALLLIYTCCPVKAQIVDSLNQQKGRQGAIRRDTVPLPLAGPLQADTLRTDSALVNTDSVLLPARKTPLRNFFTKNYPNPRKAALFSLLLPGAGQAYNRKYWKIPLVYGLLGGLGYLEYSNILQFREVRDTYRARVDGDPLTIPDPKYDRWSDATLRSNRDVAQRNLEVSSLILAGGYLLSVADAFVDAHLSTFDVSDDLSMNIRPQAQLIPTQGVAIGIGMAFVLK